MPFKPSSPSEPLWARLSRVVVIVLQFVLAGALLRDVPGSFDIPPAPRVAGIASRLEAT